jgi:DNA-binding NarL/FixJ family response regulator
MKAYSVFVVDDDQCWLDELMVALSREDRFLVAGGVTNVKDAIPFIRDAKPDILIVDIVMPGTSGIELLSHLAETMEDYAPLIYLMSAYDTQPYNDALSKLKVDCFSVKPIMPQVIVSNLKKLLAKRPGDPERDTLEMNQVLQNVFQSLGIPIHLRSGKKTMLILDIYYKGYYKYPTHSGSILTNVYKEAATMFDKSPASFERSVRSSIGYMTDARTPLCIQLFAKDLDAGVTNGIFLEIVSKYVDTLYRQGAPETKLGAFSG